MGVVDITIIPFSTRIVGLMFTVAILRGSSAVMAKT